MPIPSSVFRDCLIALDIGRAREVYAHAAAHLPQPKTNAEMEIVLHHARTQSRSVPFKLRAYSHRWLTERELPSGLPDFLRPSAEQMCPRIVQAVGVSVGTLSTDPMVIQRATEMQRVMSNAVLECYADGESDPEKIKRRMAEARARL